MVIRYESIIGERNILKSALEKLSNAPEKDLWLIEIINDYYMDRGYHKDA